MKTAVKTAVKTTTIESLALLLFGAALLAATPGFAQADGASASGATRAEKKQEVRAAEKPRI